MANSIEAETGLEAVGLMRADRTKFFDLIIPVVPFITHQSARAIASELLKGVGNKVNRELIDLAIQHTPDMRLLKNIRNEFIVFRDRILSGAGKTLDLDETKIFAMVLYKNTHFADFEKVRIGKSALDNLYRESRAVIRRRVSALQAEARGLKNEIRHRSGVEERSAEFGAQLYSYFEMTARRAGFTMPGRILFGSEVLSQEDISKAAFWHNLSSVAEEHTIVWRNPNRQAVTLTRTEIAEELGATLDPKEWESNSVETHRKRIEAINLELAFLKTADMKDLFDRPGLYDSGNETQGASSFSNVASRLLKSDLAIALVRGGHLTRNFTLYTATFPAGPETAAATNFIIHNIQRGIMDEHFSLSNGDVAYIMSQYPKAAIQDSVFYNLDIMDYLLSVNPEYAAEIMSSLKNLGSDAQRFIQAYLDGGKKQLDFIAQFAALAPDVFPYLISQVELEDSRRIQFVSHALSNLASSIKYRIDQAVADYLEDNYSQLPILASNTISATQAIRIAEFYASADASVSSLKDLSATAANAFIIHNRYVITSENLKQAVPSSPDLSLNALADEPHVYAYVLQNLGAYLQLPELDYTITQTDKLSEILNEIEERNPGHLDEIVERMKDDVHLPDTSTVSTGILPSLARHNRFPATFANVVTYIAAFGDIDEPLSTALTLQGKITEHYDAPDEDRTELALEILRAGSHLRPEARAILASSLALKDYIPAASIPIESGVLFGLLVKLHVIAANSETYDHLAGTDWATRERVLANAVYLDAETLTGFRNSGTFMRDLAEILLSSQVDNSFKTTIVSHADALIPQSPNLEATLRALARHAAASNQPVSLNLIIQMPKAEASGSDVVKLLEPHLLSISAEQLAALLLALGGQYAKLSKVGWLVAKVPNDPSHIALLGRLKEIGIVSSFDPKSTPIEVHKKRKSPV